MGKRGGKKGGRGRGGRGGFAAGRPRVDNRQNKASIPRRNDLFENYYNQLGVVPQDEQSELWDAMRRDLPNSFRFTGSRSHALAVQQRLKDSYIPEITSITYEDQYVEAPQPVKWYPDQLAWYMTTPKHVIRRFKPFASFQKFLVAETDVGNISRQEVVSMIPPLVIDIRPGMTVLDLCAAPGSKSAQLIEMIHAGEEERIREATSCLEQGRPVPSGEEYVDDGRSTGLLVANDIDYRRAHMLVHQVKRLASPNIIVTNHDATIFPSIKVAALPAADGKPIQNRYLKFDRILADVPCSGDGTPRKNLEIWRNWTPSNGLGLHQTQVNILIRALQMLKVGGRVVYSTCSMNPVEDEAVVATAIDRCGGSAVVEIMETKDLLPGLLRYPGMRTWNVMDKSGRIWKDYESVLQHKADVGEDGLSRLSAGMFPPKDQIPLERAIRVYPHQQDTGAFFITILEKRSEIRVRQQEKTVTNQEPAKVAVADSNETTKFIEPHANGVVGANGNDTTSDVDQEQIADSTSKRKRSPDEDEISPSTTTKRQKSESPSERLNVITSPIMAANPQPNGAISNLENTAADRPATNDSPVPPMSNVTTTTTKKTRDTPFEEPFKYLSPTIPELVQISSFYKLSPQFPMDRFMVRNAGATPSKNIYYTTTLAREILQENEGKGMKFVHSGVKMFVKQDAPSPETCPWRIQTDGLRILESWVDAERKIVLTKRETLRRLLVEMFPRFDGQDGDKLGEIKEQVEKMSMGCCVLIVEPTATATTSENGDVKAVPGELQGAAGGDTRQGTDEQLQDVPEQPHATTENEGTGFVERMIFPLWKSLHSVNLMLPKEERRAMLLRLFDDETPLVNPSPGWQKNQSQTDQQKNQNQNQNDTQHDERPDREAAVSRTERNSSSPDIEDDGGVEIGIDNDDMNDD